MTKYQPLISLGTPSSFEFPFQPYEIQHDFMVNLYSVLENKEIGIFESPTGQYFRICKFIVIIYKLGASLLGTGKSLSLTCGALKWLCDHENLVKQQLNDDIDSLTVRIRDDEKSIEVNWLESQHEVILKKESLLKLKKMLERLTVHDKEITAIKERRTKENKAKVKYKSGKSTESNVDYAETERDEDDEFLIENYDDKDEEADEADEKRYPGVQVRNIFSLFIYMNTELS